MPEEVRETEMKEEIKMERKTDVAKEAKEIKPPIREIVEEVVEERFYTIPLGKAWVAPRNKRAPRAVRIIRDFIKRHMKLEAGRKGEDEEVESKKIVISSEVNEKIWSRGIQKPPRKIRVKAVKDKNGNVTVHLAEGE
jgi:large subunit ribosomal protein L31e